jgi:excisionase family DNA binding protein
MHTISVNKSATHFDADMRNVYVLFRMKDTEDTKPKTKQEIAVHFGVTTRTIDGWMKAGLLPYWKIGHLVRFDLGAVTAKLNQKALRNGGKLQEAA